MEKIFDRLNEAQKEAVKSIDGSILILAGAGSGKTKTIVSRVAYLIHNGIPPNSILTLTFTNKAALEMRQRAMNLLGNNISYPPLLCTFHKFGLLFLKMYIHKIDRKNNFVIIDSDDKKNILKKLIKNAGLDINIAFVNSEISKYKNSLISATEAVVQKSIDNTYKKIAKIYQEYEEYIQERNLVDFDDLLVLTYKILNSDEELLNEISNKYRYIMVDEYQDTNRLQASILKQLCHNHNNICVVGDDDQSIYGWRGACIDNILNFHKEYNNTKIIKLELNYRSTKNILDVANQLISHNRGRIGKELKATLKEGKEVEVINSYDESKESYVVASKIKNLINQGVKPQDIAILYRLNALSRSLEEGLNRENIPYKIVGGLKFYERSEIKDIISYFRVIANQNDDFSLLRIINRPRRGVGKASIDKIQIAAKAKKLSLYSYVKNYPEELKGLITKKAFISISDFFNQIDELQAISQNSIHLLIDELDERLKIREFFTKTPDSVDRVANIEEFYGLFRDRIKENLEISIDEFLNELALESDQDYIDDSSISIMSVHASKGLEFDYLFIIGLEEGFFPLMGDGCDMEEERRLGYVAMTRAKKELILSHSASRFYKGKRSQLAKSPFLNECGACRGAFSIKSKKSFKKGDIIKHKLFGMGRVLSIKREGKNFKLTINFGGLKREIIDSFVEKV